MKLAIIRATGGAAAAAVAGFTVLNDLSARDYQFRSKEWLRGIGECVNKVVKEVAS